MDFSAELEDLLRARYYLMIVETVEELRALRLIQGVCTKLKNVLVSWDVADGFQPLSESQSAEFDISALQKSHKKGDAMDALAKVKECPDPVVFVLKDYHEFWENPLVKRKLRNLSQQLKPDGKALIIINPNKKMPDELKDEVAVFSLPMPREAELEDALKLLESKVANVKVKMTPVQRQRFLQAALGLTGSQASRVFRRAAVQNKGIIDESLIKVITEEKRQVIRQSESLEFYPVTETMADIGGLEQLKEWLNLRKNAFGEKAREYGLPAPKGLALIGIPGTGKSLTAKAIGSIWRLPLLRLDTGSLFGSFVGESEERTRRALAVSTTIAPCILWIDEIEKAFGGGDRDGGTSARVFGSILTWMQEKTAPVFVVATANNISALPPELLRKGRFDEVFFLDLPSPEERREIFSVLLSKYKRPPMEFDLDKLVNASSLFVGAELEAAIVDALHMGHSDRARPITTEDILTCLKRLIPLAKSQREAITELRRWLNEGLAISASFTSKEEAIAKSPVEEEIHLNLSD